MANSTYPGRLRFGSKGPAVKALQAQLNTYGNHLLLDGEFGAATKKVVMAFQAHRHIGSDGVVDAVVWARIFNQPPPVLHPQKPETSADTLRRLREEVPVRQRQIADSTGDRRKALVARYDKIRAAIRRLIVPAPDLRTRALAEAEKQIGVMEVGGNNLGPDVERIIRFADGVAGEPWCVDFVIWSYGHAGSQVVKPGFTRAVASMWTADLRRTTTPKPGDIVRFTFDHTGLFVRDLGNGEIETIEGNTGATGAVSDSRTGGDGVYRKHRSKSLVLDYLVVAR